MNRAKITPTFRKQILKDWRVYFPNLTIDSPACLTRRVGPLLIFLGFDVKSGREYYYPGVGVHNLCVPLDFMTATLSIDLRTLRTNAPDSISVLGHEEGRYIEATERMRKQSPLPLEGPISLSMIVNAYKEYTNSKRPKSIGLVQDPALIAAWAGQEKLAKECLDWGYKEFATWPERSHERRGGLEVWLKGMQEKISSPEKLRAIAEEQAIFHKVDHIPMEELIVD